ncbi:hypothetical protein LIS82_22970 [Cytobacillus solani]|uniref:hypothetical protein n=1 Tax=Cytobacillus solani TaxID=1637975 RepID=UPI0020796C9A|nr:hypothetical protein [Cytobacillus solani]USK54385.1 hypothetical protein LIS82_22970 [Cytobacillus solani]
MQITVKAHFNKQTKDSKKELVQFHVKGEDEKKPELRELTREVVILEIDGVDQKLRCEFNKSTKDSKKTVLEFIVKGDASAENTFNFYKKAGTDVNLKIIEAQMSTDDFEDDHEGVKYKVNNDGTASVVAPDQMSIEDIENEKTEDNESLGESADSLD